MLRRSKIRKAREKSKRFFLRQQRLGVKSDIYKSCKFVLRTQKFTIDYNKLFECLDNINFIYDSINKHWAETDGHSISLNTFKNFSHKLLTNTLIHEALHDVIYRDSRHIIPEKKEHRIMELINPQLL